MKWEKKCNWVAAAIDEGEIFYEWNTKNKEWIPTIEKHENEMSMTNLTKFRYIVKIIFLIHIIGIIFLCHKIP